MPDVFDPPKTTGEAMKMTRSHLRALVALLALGIGVAPGAAYAGDTYPVNSCVATKQANVGIFCKRVFKAWSKWEVQQDDATRDTAIAHASTKLAFVWDRADQAAAQKNSDCTDATLDASEAAAIVDSAVAGFVGAVNDGITPGHNDGARCAARLIKAAGSKCNSLMHAEGKHVRNLAVDAQSERLDGDRAKAEGKFTRVVERLACPTNASGAGLEGLVDDLSNSLVRNTIVSPKVDDTQFTTIFPPTTVSYEGRDYHPICKSGTPYAYFVKRGSVNKLLVYYQGGGACWENLTCSFGTCDPSVDPGGSDNPNNVHSGFADLSNPNNPFRDWNIVFVSYCSCDIHFGDSAQDYAGAFPTIHVEHRGYENARVVEKFAREHFIDPDEVFVTGSSAGAYGAWFNAPIHERVWPASHFDVLADAGNGVVTQDFLNNEFPNWNFEANLPTDIPGLAATLHNGTGIPGYTQVVANYFPGTRWAHYASAYDGGTGGQTGFYNVMLNPDNVPEWLNWWDATCQWHDVMRQQAVDTAAALPSNYRYYIGTGSRHTMWGSDKVYNDTTGGVPTLVDWVNGMLNGTPAWSNVECTNCGLLLSGDPRPSPLVPPFTQQGADVVVQCPSSPSGAFLDTPAR
jgi:hypothetical protein